MTDAVVAQNIAKLSEKITTIAQNCGRARSDVLLLAVSKTRPAALIAEACHAGLNHMGENYLQEALTKIEALRDLPLCWHFIGPIQSNKTRAIAGNFDWVHSVDRLKIARRLSQQRPADMAPLQVCLQVNINGEDSKSGVAPEQLPALAAEINQLPALQLRGLMAIPAASTDPAEQRRVFGRVRETLRALQRRFPKLDTLSMGMSGDMESAIVEGATILRIGTAVFGPRNK